jgi:hypothetical protein
MIQEDWDLTCDTSTNSFAGPAFDAVFDVTLLDPATGAPTAHGAPTKRHEKLVVTEQGNGFDVAYVYTPTNTDLTSAFSLGGEVWTGMQGVVDTLTQPNWVWNVYDSTFDDFTWSGAVWGYPGYITSQATLTNALYPSLSDGLTKNFYCYAHGTSDSLGTYTGDVRIKASDVAQILGNHYTPPDPKKPGQGGLVPTLPYRFVFLDGCATASQPTWRRAFGIFPIWADDRAARYKLHEQAYVGWADLKAAQLDGVYGTNGVLNISEAKAEESAYTATLQWFFLDWMNGASLYQCIKNASDTNLAPCPFPVPGTTTYTIGYPFASPSFTLTNSHPSKIFVVGHSGLTRDGLQPGDDGKLEADRNIQ